MERGQNTWVQATPNLATAVTNRPTVLTLRTAGPPQEPQISRLAGVVHTTANALITVFSGLCHSHFQHNADGGGINDGTGIPAHTDPSLSPQHPRVTSLIKPPRTTNSSPDGGAISQHPFFFSYSVLFCFHTESNRTGSVTVAQIPALCKLSALATSAS